MRRSQITLVAVAWVVTVGFGYALGAGALRLPEQTPLASEPADTPVVTVACAIQRHGPPWDGPELIVNGPDGSCRSLQVSLAQLGVWDSLPAGKTVTAFQDGAQPVFVCGGPWGGLDIEVYYSESPNNFHPDYSQQVCAALSLPGR